MLVIERPDQPLIIVSEVEVQRPYAPDNLGRVFADFAFNTDVALGAAIGKIERSDEAMESVEYKDRLALLLFFAKLRCRPATNL